MDKVVIRQVKDRVFFGVVVSLSLLVMLPLFFILFHIFKKGFSVISWKFLTSLPKPVGEPDGGISNAIVGTLILVSLSSIMAVPLGILAGIYLCEEGKSRIAEVVRLCIDVLQGVPSIVVGIIAYFWVVVPLGGFSALSGAVALSIMMLPMVVRSTEETLRMVPYSLREAAMALGVPYYKTVLKVVVPAGISGIATGVLVSVARVAGETAPLLFTAFGSPYMNLNIMKPINSLPLLIFNYAMSPYQDWQRTAWGASVVLIVIVLLLNLLSKLVVRRWKVQF